MTKSITLKNLYLLSATLLLLTFAYSALAQEVSSVPASDQVEYEISPTGTPPPVPTNTIREAPVNVPSRGENRPVLMEERKDKIEERKTEVEGIIEERKTALREVQQERIINLAANISNRMDGAISRLFTIIERLEQRMVKMKEAGVATEPAEEKLREAARNLSEARSLMQDIDVYVNEATASTEPVGKWQEVRERYLSVGKLIRLAHQNLRETVALLKEVTKEEVRPNEETESGTTSPALIEL